MPVLRSYRNQSIYLMFFYMRETGFYTRETLAPNGLILVQNSKVIRLLNTIIRSHCSLHSALSLKIQSFYFQQDGSCWEVLKIPLSQNLIFASQPAFLWNFGFFKIIKYFFAPHRPEVYFVAGFQLICSCILDFSSL